MARELMPEGYGQFLRDLKDLISRARLRVALSVNRELILLYRQIGRNILREQKEQGWGAKVIDRLAADLRRAFPDTKGFSPRNLKYMRALAEAYPDFEFVQQVAAQIPWVHNCVLLDKIKDQAEREWYVRQTIEHGWSMRHPNDNPTIGLILCKTKDGLTVEYALRDMSTPIGVAEWKTQTLHSLPDNLRGGLPTIEEIGAELARVAEEEKPT
jgi:predicted nuclease of restriction endonuclease-like (RecB) superfamily